MNNVYAILNQIVPLTKEQEAQLETYYQELVKTSKVMNLTTIIDYEDVYIKHFYDSMFVLRDVTITSNMKLLDIGSGAGFPGLVIKIVYPKMDITLLEPTKKRCDFLETVIRKLNLQNIRVVNDRAENYIKEKREFFDFVVARAVANISIISELAIPYLKVNGLFLAMKGQNYEEECQNIDHILHQLSSKVSEYLHYELPLEKGKRVIIRIQKLKKTPLLYPRTYAKIKNKPLE